MAGLLPLPDSFYMYGHRHLKDQYTNCHPHLHNTNSPSANTSLLSEHVHHLHLQDKHFHLNNTIVESTEEYESESESEEAEIESESALESTESENAELDETAEAAYAEAQAAEIGSAHISCWYQNSNGTWYYYDENGNSVSYKAMTIDGKIYYFGGDGMVANDLYYLDGNAYLAYASSRSSSVKNGWFTTITGFILYVWPPSFKRPIYKLPSSFT